MQTFKLHLNLVSRVQNQGARQVRNGVSHTSVQSLYHLDCWSNTIDKNPDTNNKIRTMERFIEYVVIHYKIILAPFNFFLILVRDTGLQPCTVKHRYHRCTHRQLYATTSRRRTSWLHRYLGLCSCCRKQYIHLGPFFFFYQKGCTPTADSCSGIKYSGPIAIFLMTSYASPDNISLTEKDKQCRLNCKDIKEKQ